MRFAVERSCGNSGQFGRSHRGRQIPLNQRTYKMKPETTLKQLFDEGMKNRREVLGAEYVDRSVNNANDFTMAFQHITTEWCWGYGWGENALSRKTRSMLNLAMLTALHC